MFLHITEHKQFYKEYNKNVYNLFHTKFTG